MYNALQEAARNEKLLLAVFLSFPRRGGYAIFGEENGRKSRWKASGNFDIVASFVAGTNLPTSYRENRN